MITGTNMWILVLKKIKRHKVDTIPFHCCFLQQTRCFQRSFAFFPILVEIRSICCTNCHRNRSLNSRRLIEDQVRWAGCNIQHLGMYPSVLGSIQPTGPRYLWSLRVILELVLLEQNTDWLGMSLKNNQNVYFDLIIPHSLSGSLLQSAPINSTKKYAKIVGRIQQGVELWVSFNKGSQWNVSRANGQIKWIGWIKWCWLYILILDRTAQEIWKHPSHNK